LRTGASRLTRRARLPKLACRGDACPQPRAAGRGAGGQVQAGAGSLPASSLAPIPGPPGTLCPL
jgi:hypothetical protein